MRYHVTFDNMQEALKLRVIFEAMGWQLVTKAIPDRTVSECFSNTWAPPATMYDAENQYPYFEGYTR